MSVRLHTRYTVAGLLILLSAVGHASTSATTSSTTDLASQVSELFADWNGGDRPGAVAAVFRDGEIVYQGGFGMADLERSVPITPASVFEIGSISKQFTAMCILLLENDGRLALDDDIRSYIPEMPGYESPVTLRHLLHHTSGVRDIETLVPLAGLPWFNYQSREQLLELIARQKALNFSPGEEFLYSNSGYLLLAEVISRVSGQSLRDFARTRIFEPLGMASTVFWDRPGQLVPNRALAYSPDGEDEYRLEMWNLPFDGPAGLYTSVRDLALWDANFYDNKLGGGNVLIERMETPGLLENGESTGYAAGLGIGTDRELRVVRHGGAWMGYRAEMRRYPERHLTVVLLANVAAMDVHADQVADLLLTDDSAPSEQPTTEYEPPTAIELPEAELANYQGTFWNASDGLLRTIELRDGRLHYVRGSDNSTELGALESGMFFMVGIETPVRIEFGEADGSRTMTVEVENEEVLLFEPLPPTSGEILSAYSGAYWSDELQRELRVEIVGEEITASWADEESHVSGRLVAPDEALLPEFIPVPWDRQDTRLRFERDHSGQVTGMSLRSNMVRGVSFEKRL